MDERYVEIRESNTLYNLKHSLAQIPSEDKDNRRVLSIHQELRYPITDYLLSITHKEGRIGEKESKCGVEREMQTKVLHYANGFACTLEPSIVHECDCSVNLNGSLTGGYDLCNLKLESVLNVS